MTFVALLVVQSLMLNRIQLFHCATPLLCVYFAITMPRGYPKWASLVWCFALGICVDVFANTPGVAAGSMTFVAALQPYLLELFLPREAEENIKSSAAALGFSKFATLATILVLLFCLVFFSLEAFSFYDWQQWTLSVAGSALLTLVLILTLETLRR
mgnify:CR=1 FL=1